MRDFATVLIHPRETMRRILDAGRDRAVPLLVLAAIAAGFLRDFDIAEYRKVTAALDVNLALFVPMVLIGLALLFYLFFHLIAFVAMIIGRFLDGNGNYTAVRSALAWGLAPVVWGLLYRIPFAIWVSTSEAIQGAQAKLEQGTLRVDPGLLAHGCGAALLVTFLDLVVLVWTLFVTSNTLAEANGISTPRGFAILALTFVAPMVVMIAAVLAIVF